MSQRAVSSPPPRPSSASWPHNRRPFRRGDQSGAAILEFALVIPVFIFVLYGLITFGVILAQKQQITAAASDGARAAVGSSSDVLAKSAAKTRVEQSLGAPGKYTASYTTSTCSSLSPTTTSTPSTSTTSTTLPPATTGNCITVDVVYNYAANPLVPPAPGLGLFTPKTFHSTAVVQYS